MVLIRKEGGGVEWVDDDDDDDDDDAGLMYPATPPSEASNGDMTTIILFEFSPGSDLVREGSSARRSWSRMMSQFSEQPTYRYTMLSKPIASSDKYIAIICERTPYYVFKVSRPNHLQLHRLGD